MGKKERVTERQKCVKGSCASSVATIEFPICMWLCVFPAHPTAGLGVAAVLSNCLELGTCTAGRAHALHIADSGSIYNTPHGF